jgi:hypothetical protein
LAEVSSGKKQVRKGKLKPKHPMVPRGHTPLHE